MSMQGENHVFDLLPDYVLDTLARCGSEPGIRPTWQAVCFARLSMLVCSRLRMYYLLRSHRLLHHRELKAI